jgi:hypothetical protein
MIRTAVALLMGLTLLGGQDRAQFRGGTDLVSIYATVVDRNRRLVPDLRQQDFVVTDNGRPADAVVFHQRGQPFPSCSCSTRADR